MLAGLLILTLDDMSCRTCNQIVYFSTINFTQASRVIRRQVGQGQGGTFEKALPIHYSNLALYEPEVDGPIKTCWRYNEAGKHVRISKVTGKPMPVPQPYLKKPEPGPAGPKDSFMNEVQDVTYKPIQMTFEKYMQKAQMARRQASVGGRVDKTILHASRRNYF
ncbi:hypothetical protein SARC_03641 [Sphaeroforma arctica JP610]|uniref:Large ribosomal subunit protein uL24 C-terminal domain-containing protein n=1 Tax=Sphaeroforma arctica JP610 TaxID=667725 RepID=A0A0L0G523_9EUKA|nr:hypothetical protein SARC_03641 [Sphaeroforma arctica JP610]KNC84120.1 hypothetical protein SARC_03641 [Sphaeroforma arctica JP610]|eukprot:XP_014158022.1 hypothetical protein SARC_03641 [Sphaeroforma arctica JP610]